MANFPFIACTVGHHGRSIRDRPGLLRQVIEPCAYLRRGDRIGPPAPRSLATLFQPSNQDERARHSLRRTLYSLRRLIEDPDEPDHALFAGDPYAIQFNRESNSPSMCGRICWSCGLPAATSTRPSCTCVACAHRLEQLVGPGSRRFSGRISVDDRPEFDD